MLRTTVIGALLGAVSFLSPVAAEADETGLVTQMGRMQYFTHKLGLAIAAQNKPLQDFYAHEVEEVIEHVGDIKEQDGVPIRHLIETILVPAFESLERAIDAADPAAVEGAYDGLLAACNKCHHAANRPYLVVERRTDNPYMQRFAPAP